LPDDFQGNSPAAHVVGHDSYVISQGELDQSYKSRTGYCTVFSLQRDVPDLRISIPGSYRFEFQKIKNIKVQNFEILFKFAYTGRYLTENTRTTWYLAVQTSAGRYLTGTISDINM